MRRIVRSLVVNFFLLALVAVSFGAKDESLEQLKAHFETARPEDRADLGIRIGQLQLRNADKLYVDGNVEQAVADVNEVVSYSEKARDAATETNKHLKNVEIDVRKMAEKLRDIKRTLAFEDQPPVEQAIRRLEEVRTSLLKAMFAKENKAEKK
jgi:ketosteroid isomerase-like protein